MLVTTALLATAAFACSISRGTTRCGFEFLLLPGKRVFNALKNRAAPPAPGDFDNAVTLAALLVPGDDRRRWSDTRAGRVEGYVIRVYDAAPESANCFSPNRLDAHIEVATRLDAAAEQRVILEVTPPMRDWAAARNLDWSTAALQRQLTGKRVRFEGWLLFDDEHDEESVNTAPGNRANWRATAWEIHPVTSMTVVGDGSAF